MYLQLGGTEVRCMDAKRTLGRTGSTGRSIAGKLGSRVLARKREWQFASVPMSLADGATLRGLLDGTTRTATGDFAPFGSVQVVGSVDGCDFVQLADGLNTSISFTLREV